MAVFLHKVLEDSLLWLLVLLSPRCGPRPHVPGWNASCHIHVPNRRKGGRRYKEYGAADF